MSKIKKIKGFSDYSITDSGKVISEKNGGFKWLVASKRKDGYTEVTFLKEGKQHHKLVHRIVAQAFIPNPDNKPCVDHINGVRTDNRVCNLRWCTQQENCSFPLARKHNSEAKKGKRKGKPRPEGAGVPPKTVKQYTKDGVYVASYISICEAARETGISKRNISSVCIGKRNSAGGYKWAYLN